MSVHYRKLAIAILGLALAVFAATGISRAQAPQSLVIGVIGQVDSPTAHGLQLAISRFGEPNNTLVVNNTLYRIMVMAQHASTADAVSSAVAALRQANAIAIFGPDSASLVNPDALAKAGVPVFTAAQSASLVLQGTLFRTRAEETRMIDGLVDYLLKDLARTRVAIFQGDPSQAGTVMLLNKALTNNNLKPVTTVIQTIGGAIPDSARALINAQPDTVIAIGIDMQAATVLQSLRTQGYGGAFVYPDAADTEFIHALPATLQSGIIGMTNWVYSSAASPSRDFVDAYVAMFGEVPTAESAAAYDAAGALIFALHQVGPQPDALRRQLLAFPKTVSIQGHYNPALGHNTLSADIVVFTTGDYGAPIPEAQYDETGRIPVSVPSATPTPTPSPAPSKTPTPSGVSATLKVNANVYAGPASSYPVLGQLSKGQSAVIFGLSQDNIWLVIDFQRRQGWIRTDQATITGNLRSVPIVAAPPTPTPARLPYPDLRVINAVISPSIVHQGQPFAVTATIKNLGIVDAGSFAVAATFIPGNAYTAAIVPGLAAGATTTVNLKATVMGGVGTFTVAIVVDLNNQVFEGPYAIHKKFPVTYVVQP